MKNKIILSGYSFLIKKIEGIKEETKNVVNNYPVTKKHKCIKLVIIIIRGADASCAGCGCGLNGRAPAKKALRRPTPAHRNSSEPGYATRETGCHGESVLRPSAPCESETATGAAPCESETATGAASCCHRRKLRPCH